MTVMNVRRIALFILLMLAGIASLVYGLLFHAVAVEEEKQREISIAVPTLPGMEQPPFERRGNVEAQPPAAEPGAGDGDPFRTPPPDGSPQGDAENPFASRPMPPGLPGMKLVKDVEKYVEVGQEPEWVIVREVTVGGVVRLANGQLKRTYSGKAPSLCPT
jgi:hypothetical protein